MRTARFVPPARLSDGLERHLHQALRKQKLARRDLNEEVIHDFRVAIRRCRSLAEQFSEMDPRPVWRELRKVCRQQLRGLSELRDTQVMAEWVHKLKFDSEPDGQILVENLTREQKRLLRPARASLKSFPRKRWKRWSRELPDSAGALPVGATRLARIAFDLVSDLCVQESHWRRSRSAASWHRLRLAVKRLRYAIESFLPKQQTEWGSELKELQTSLGEGHDLDGLRSRILTWTRHAEVADEVRLRWLETIRTARAARTELYLQFATIAERPAIRARRQRNAHPAESRGKRSIYDWWREEMGRLAKVSPADAARPGRSGANSRWPRAAQNPRFPHRRLRLS